VEQENNQKIKILISGPLNFGPIGRHALSFISALSENKSNQILVDDYWIDKSHQQDLVAFIEENNANIVSDPESSGYDFLIYTGVLSHGASDRQIDRIIDLKAKIKICYPVFDGTVPPLEWIDIINDHFDICSPPSNYVAHNLARYGIKVPCFGLHCAILNDELLKQRPNDDDKKIRFGFIGAAEQRKNPIKVIEAFHKSFAKNDNVELFMHCSYSFEEKYLEELKSLVRKYSKTSNIIFSYGENKSHDEMVEIFSSFNCYIYPQKTSGYFTTPAEALSLGIPIIISDIGVHQELVQHSFLKEKDGLFLIPCGIAEYICHHSLDKRYLGAQYDCVIDDISEAMLKFYKMRKELFSKPSINKRKKAGLSYNAKSLAVIYNNLINPKEIYISKSDNQIQEDILCINSERVYQKYKKIYSNINLAKKKPKLTKFDFNVNDERVTNIIEHFSVLIQNQYFQISSKDKIVRVLEKYKKTFFYRLKEIIGIKSHLKQSKAIESFISRHSL
jgi:glycosyltransferase involved in cell wall biosynthesis